MTQNRDSHHFSDNDKPKHPEIGDCPYFSLDVDRIEAARQNERLGRKVVVFRSTASTNDIAWQYAANPKHDGLCVLAESQSKGRGRRGRTWYSEPGQSILLSILLCEQPHPAEWLTLTAAVATAEALSAGGGPPCRIKWPNDILAGGKKLAGILVESKSFARRQACVIGIGINCSQPPEAFAGLDLNMPATSLTIETGRPVDRCGLVCRLLKTLEGWLAKSADPQAVLTRWQQQSDLLGRHITLESDNQRYSGFCRGIDPAEGLIVHLDTGTVRVFNARHTSILHVNG